MDFLDRFSENNQIENLINIRPVGADLFLSDRLEEANSRLLQYCEHPL
jgi:hypothetical protein